MSTSTIKDPAAIADYACLLSEAAYVLSALAEADTSNRYTEFQVLQAIYSESVTSDLIVSLHSRQERRDATMAHHLSSMFSSVMAIGAILTPYDDDELPPVAVLGVHAIERLTRALTYALDGRSTDANIERVFQESHTLESGTFGEDHGHAPINVLSAVAIADSRMAAFTACLTRAQG